MNYKDRINGGFAGCRLLAYAHDNCRNREVRLYLLPESDECVGVADGTDAWIAPTSASLFSVNVQRIIEDLRAGKPFVKPVAPGPRVERVKLKDAPIPRRTLINAPTKESRRVLQA